MSESKYGEPWIVRVDGLNVGIYNAEGVEIDARRTRMTKEEAERVVACVNALAGKDPSKLEGLIAAIDNLKVKEEDFWDDDYLRIRAIGDATLEMYRCLSEFRGQTT